MGLPQNTKPNEETMQQSNAGVRQPERHQELPPETARTPAVHAGEQNEREPVAVKCAMVIDEDLPQGLAVNAASVLALTLGRRIDSILGPDTKDGSGRTHVGITTLPIPILRATSGRLKEIRLTAGDLDGLLVVDFSGAAQSTTTYEAYTEKIGRIETDRLDYLAVALYGSKKHVNKLTGSLPLMR